MSGDADRSGLDSRLADVATQYDALQAQLASPAVTADPDAIRRIGQELSRLEPVVAAFRNLEATRHEL
jgi:peptide chain release factor 1